MGHQGSKERAKGPRPPPLPRKYSPSIVRGLPVWLDVGETIAAAKCLLNWGSKLMGFRFKGCRDELS